MSMLTRLQTSKTDKFEYYFVLFLLSVNAINVEGLTPDFTVEVFEGIQPKWVPLAFFALKSQGLTTA